MKLALILKLKIEKQLMIMKQEIFKESLQINSQHHMLNMDIGNFDNSEFNSIFN